MSEKDSIAEIGTPLLKKAKEMQANIKHQNEELSVTLALNERMMPILDSIIAEEQNK